MDNNQYFKMFEQWIESDDREPCAVDCFAEIKSVVLRYVYQQNHDELMELHIWLTPLVAKLSLRLKQDKVSLAMRQSVEAPLLAALVRGVLHIMEKEDPRRAVELIRHGAAVLSILLEKEGDIRLGEFCDLWPEGNPPSVSTISRALSALEEAGFVQRSGATRGRRYLVLTKAKKWGETRREEETEVPAPSSLPVTEPPVANEASEADESLTSHETEKENADDAHVPIYFKKVEVLSADDFRDQVSGTPQ